MGKISINSATMINKVYDNRAKNIFEIPYKKLTF